MEIINDSKNRICVVTDDRDEFGQCYKTERVIPIEKAIELKNQLSDAIDKAEKQGLGSVYNAKLTSPRALIINRTMAAWLVE